MREIILLITNPKKLFVQLGERNVPWANVFIIMILFYFINQLLQLPIGTQILNNSDTLGNLSSEQINMVKTMQGKMKYVGLFISLLMFVLEILFYTIILWGGVSIISNGIKFVQVFFLLATTYLIIIFGELANTSLLYYSGYENINSQYEILRLGLNVFFDYKTIGGVFLWHYITSIPFKFGLSSFFHLGLKQLLKLKLKSLLNCIYILDYHYFDSNWHCIPW